MSNKPKQKRKDKIGIRDNRAEIMGISRREASYGKVRTNVLSFVEGSAFNLIIALLILFNVTLLFAELLLPVGVLREKIGSINDIITLVFVVELSVRYFVAPNKRIFFANYWIDILSVLPALRVFRGFRVLRLFRLLRLTRVIIVLLNRSGWFSRSIQHQFGSFLVLFITMLMLILCGSLAMLSLEKAGMVSFDDFITSIWSATFLFISGEVVAPLPDTQGGKLVAVLISLSGLVIFAIMVGTISASMTAFFQKRMDPKDLDIKDLRNHLIICGWESMGGMILSELEAVPDIWNKGVVVIAETDMNLAQEAKLKNARRFFHIKEDFTKIDILESAGAKYAKTAIVLADKGDNLREQDRDARTVLAALTLEKINPEIFTCAELLNGKNATHLKIAGVEEVISRVALTAGLFASSAVNQGITKVVSDIMTHYEGNYMKKIVVPSELRGKTFFEAFQYFKKDFDATVLAVDTIEGDKGYQQHVNPPKDQILSETDRLVLVLKRESELCDLNL